MIDKNKAINEIEKKLDQLRDGEKVSGIPPTVKVENLSEGTKKLILKDLQNQQALKAGTPPPVNKKMSKIAICAAILGCLGSAALGVGITLACFIPKSKSGNNNPEPDYNTVPHSLSINSSNVDKFLDMAIKKIAALQEIRYRDFGDKNITLNEAYANVDIYKAQLPY
jgi:hypothetical protein